MFGDMTLLVVLAVLFFVVANPMTYKVVDQLLSSVGMSGQVFDSLTGQVSQFGVALHTVVFVGLFCVYQKYVAPMMQDVAAVEEVPKEEEEEVEGFMEHLGEDDMPEDELDVAAELGLDSTEEPEGPGMGGPEGPEGPGMDGPEEEIASFEGFESGGMGAAY